MKQHNSNKKAIKVKIVVIPEATLSGVSGIYDVFHFYKDVVPDTAPFEVELVAPSHTLLNTASGLPLNAHAVIRDVDQADIVIIPSLLLPTTRWQAGRYPDTVAWLNRMYDQGATLCSACSGLLLLAETGLLDNQEATLHWDYERTCRENFPNVRLAMDKVLLTAGQDQRLVMSGTSSAWHDLVLYLIARFTGPASAIAVAKYFLLQWHTDGQSSYSTFEEVKDHGDAIILQAQQWLSEHLDSDNPIEEVVKQSNLAERSFKRRFNKATGYAPIVYIQNLRVEAAKRQLESSDKSFDEISYTIGYEDPAFFRRLFKRTTGLTPGAYRKKFRVPLMM
jgi:transcriptional regulator GlxA family with amidase domain